MTGGGDLHQLCCLLLSVSPMHDIVSGPTAPTTCSDEYSFSCSCLNLCLLGRGHIICKQFTNVNCNSSDHKLYNLARSHIHCATLAASAVDKRNAHSVLYTFNCFST